MTWGFVRFFWFTISLCFLLTLGLPSLFGESFRQALFEKPPYVIVPVIVTEMLMYPILMVAIIDRLIPDHTKSNICAFKPRKFLEDYFAAHPVTYPAIYSAVYPVVYVAIATCTTVYSTNPVNWFAQSGMLMFTRSDLVKLNGVSKLNFIYTLAQVLFALKGSWVSFISAYQLYTEKWSISTSDKVITVLATIRLVLGVLWTFYCVIQSIRIEFGTVDSADRSGSEKETDSDKVVGNLGILAQFTLALLPVALL